MDRESRQHILRVALRHFADRGYAGASVQDIVDEAKVAKPMLYYYFKSKAGLYQALIDTAHDERMRIMREAVTGRATLQEQLQALLLALFAFIQKHRELVRLAFASAFASPGELPEGLSCKDKCERSFDFIHDLMLQSIVRGELDESFQSHDLAVAWYGIMTIFTVGQILRPDISYSEETATSMVNLFLNGAGAKSTEGNVRALPRATTAG